MATLDTTDAARFGVDAVQGAADRPRRRRLRRGAQGLQRDDRQASGADRALRRRRTTSPRPSRFAREHDLLLAVRGGGHNGAGLGTCDDGRRHRPLAAEGRSRSIPQARTVRVGGGCTWGEVDAATNEHGLATPSGIISTTGVGGLTLGGGIGPPDPQVRPRDRQPARGRDGARQRRARARERRRAPRPLLGDPRRRRQLRRRHLVHVPAARGRHRDRRPDLLAGRGGRRGPRRLPRVPARTPRAS